MATKDSSKFTSWRKQNKLGEGTFEVWQVLTDRGDLLAAKYIKLASLQVQTIPTAVKNEIDILQQLDHKNVVQFVAIREVLEDGCRYMVVFTESIDGMNLADHKKLSEDTAKGYLRQICLGLNYLHTLSDPVLHRDIKGENIMVAKDGTVKLIDFGISINIMAASGVNVSQTGVYMKYAWGTLPFMAPELFNTPSKFSVKSDVWALGITIYQMMAGKVPFVDIRSPEEKIRKIKTSGAPPLPAGCSDKLADFYARCTTRDPAVRQSVGELLQHRLFS